MTDLQRHNCPCEDDSSLLFFFLLLIVLFGGMGSGGCRRF